jgi:hypothetical protein
MHPTPRQSPFVVTAIRELDSGVNAHTLWLGNVHKALICAKAGGRNRVCRWDTSA